jgi:type III secretion protein Q
MKPEVPLVRFAPPRLTRNEADARSLLARHVRRREVVIGDIAWELTLEPLPRDASIAFGENDWLVVAEWGGAVFELRLPVTASDQWVRARFPSLDLPKLPAPLRAATFESALTEALEILGATGYGPVRIESVEEAAAASGRHSQAHLFGVTLAACGVTVSASLATDLMGLMLMGAAANEWGASHVQLRTDVPVTLRAEVGAACLSHSELASLVPGDAVLLRESFVGHSGELWLGGGGWGLRVRAEGSQLMVTAPFQPKTEELMDDDFDDLDEGGGTDGDDDALALDALPVMLRFDLGQRRMTLAQVSELQVGQVLELDRPLSSAVGIRVNGALIGQGELLEIGGRLAISITSIGRAKTDAKGDER